MSDNNFLPWLYRRICTEPLRGRKSQFVAVAFVLSAGLPPVPEKGVSILTLTSMIISNQNKHDRPDIHAIRRANVAARPVDVEIEKGPHSNLA
jgi:hypothetical protein